MSLEVVTSVDGITPVVPYGDIWLKQDDLFVVGGAKGGKARACWALAQEAKGLITAGSPDSPQMQIVARIARHRGIPCRCHCSKKQSIIKDDAVAHGAELVIHKHGRQSNINHKSVRDAASHPDWTFIPFGMKGTGAVEYTRRQVAGIPDEVKRIVVCVGGGMSAAGVLLGLEDAGLNIPVLGIQVGGDPSKGLDKYVPNWRNRMTLERHPYDYETAVDATVGGVRLDPFYDAKCAKYLQPGDLFWIIGKRSDEAVEAALAKWKNKKPKLAEDKPSKASKAAPRTPAPRQAAAVRNAGAPAPVASGVAEHRNRRRQKALATRLEELTGVEAKRLERLEAVAKQRADRCEFHLRRAIHEAKRCGDALNRIKALLGYGHWTPWLKANFELSHCMANVYMSISQEWETKIQPVLAEQGHLTIEEARVILRQRTQRDENAFRISRGEVTDSLRRDILEGMKSWAERMPDELIVSIHPIWPQIWDELLAINRTLLGTDKLIGNYQSGGYRYELRRVKVEAPTAVERRSRSPYDDTWWLTPAPRRRVFGVHRSVPRSLHSRFATAFPEELLPAH